MASGEDLECKTGTLVAVAWSQARLQEFADEAVKEKSYIIRKRLGDEDLQLSCKCPALM